jgi:hypothetical protein
MQLEVILSVTVHLVTLTPNETIEEHLFAGTKSKTNKTKQKRKKEERKLKSNKKENID